MSIQVDPIPGQFFRVTEELTRVLKIPTVRVSMIARLPEGGEAVVKSLIVDHGPRKWETYYSDRGEADIFLGRRAIPEDVTPELVAESMQILKDLYVDELRKVPLSDILGDYPPKTLRGGLV